MAANTHEALRQEVNSLTPDNAVARAAYALGQLAVIKPHVDILNRVVLGLFLIVFGLGAGFVYQGQQHRAQTAQLVTEKEALQEQISRLTQQNAELTAVAKPMLDKIARGANYIHATYKVPKATAQHYSQLIMESALEKDIAYELAVTLIGKECGFNCTVSYNGSSYGLTQVNCYWHCKAYGVTKEDLLKPEVAIPIGFDILANNRKRWGDMFTALERYSGHRDPNYNRAYAEDMMRRYANVKQAIKRQRLS